MIGIRHWRTTLILASALASLMFVWHVAAAEGPVHTTPFMDYQPALLQTDDGPWLLVFERLDSSTLNGDLYSTRTSDGGLSWTEPVAVIADSRSTRHPALINDGDGGMLLFYLADSAGPDQFRIHRAQSSDGQVWQEFGALELGWTTPGEINPDVVRHPDGGLTMTYQRLGGAVYIARSVDGGVTWDSTRTQVSPAKAQLPRVAYRESDGRYAVAYQVGGSDIDIFVRYSDDPYNWTAEPIPVSVDNNSHDPDPHYLADGRLALVHAMQSGQEAFDVYLRESMDEDGLLWYEPTRLTNDQERFDTQPHLEMLRVGDELDDELHLVWSHEKSERQNDVWLRGDLPLQIPGTPASPTTPVTATSATPAPTAGPTDTATPPDRLPVYLPFVSNNFADDDFLALLDADGSRDPRFRMRVRPPGEVKALLVLPNGSMLVAGEINDLSGSRETLVRLHKNGAIDTAFNADIDGVVNTVVRQDDGKLYVAGEFASVDGKTRHNLARLEADGEMDESFGSASGPDGAVTSLALTVGNKLLIAGDFSRVGSEAASGVARLHLDGSLDMSFQSQIVLDGDTGERLRLVAADLGGKVLVAGQMTVGNERRVTIARLHTEGAIDKEYDSSDIEGVASCWERQPDGKYLLGGILNLRGDTGVHHVIRLLRTGAIDSTFQPYRFNYSRSYMPWVGSILVLPDARTFVGGGMTQYPSGATDYVLAELDSRGSEVRRFHGLFDSPAGVKSIDALGRHDAGRVLVGGSTLER